jgi:predicted permease
MAAQVFSVFRGAVRGLAAAPAFTATAVLSLAIGLGANAAIFTVVHALLLAPPPGVPAPDRLVDIGRTTAGTGFDSVSYRTFTDLRDGTSVFSGVYATQIEPQPVSLGFEDGAERVYAEIVSASYFDVLGLAPALGDFFHASEEAVGVPLRKVVLSDAFWRSRFGGESGIVGRELVLNRETFRVTGITPRGYRGTTILSPDIWLPITAQAQGLPTTGQLTGRRNNWLMMGARLAPGRSVAQASQAVAAFGETLRLQDPEVYDDRGLVVAPMSRVPGEAGAFVRPFVAVLMGLAGLVLVVACTNLAGLFVARATSRSRDVAVRLALGASRRSIAAMFVAESVVLFTAGAAAAMLVGHWAARTLEASLGSLPFPVALDLTLDWRVLLFTAAIAALASVATAALPGWQSARALVQADLRADASTPKRRRLRQAFVAAQIACSVVLVALAGLFVHALGTAASIDSGMRIDGVQVASVNLDLGGYARGAWPDIARDLLARLRAEPGIASAAFARVVPLEGSGLGLGTLRRPGSSGPDSAIDTDWNTVSPGYLDVLGIPLISGRGFDDADEAGAPRVAIVNEQFARVVWPHENPVGQILELGDSVADPATERLTVIGVARDSKYRWIGEAPRSFILVPYAQAPLADVRYFLRAAAGRGAGTAAAVRSAVRDVNRQLPLIDVAPLTRYADLGLLPQRLVASLGGLLGGVALLLAAIGVYGITSQAVASRTKEIGIRVALGADTRRIERLVLGHGARVALTGGAIGVAAALGVAQLVRSMLFGVSPADPIAFGGAVVALAAIALVASLAPARRAARLDPVTALRAE